MDDLTNITTSLNTKEKEIKSEFEKSETEEIKMEESLTGLAQDKEKFMEKLIALKIEIEDIVTKQNNLDNKYNSIKTVNILLTFYILLTTSLYFYEQELEITEKEYEKAKQEQLEKTKHLNQDLTNIEKESEGLCYY